MSKRAPLVVVGLLFLALLPRPASAWWETTVTTNKWEYDGVEYLSSTGNKEKILWSGSVYGYERIEIKAKANVVPTANGYFYCGTAPWIGCYRNGGGNYACQYGSSNPNYNLGITFDTKENLIIQDNSVGSLTLTGRVTKTYSAISTSNASRSIALFGPTWTEDLNCRIFYFKHFIDGEMNIHYVPVLHEGEGKMLDLVHNTLYANAGTGAFTYGAVTGKVVTAFDRITTNRVYHANPPASAYDALSPWNAPERTRLGGDARTLRPSAIIKEN